MGSKAEGVIAAGQSYTLEEFQARVGLERSAMRTARSNGLPVRYVANRGYVLGEDWLAFLKTAPLEHAGGRTSKPQKP